LHVQTDRSEELYGGRLTDARDFRLDLIFDIGSISILGAITSSFTVDSRAV